MVEPVTKAKRRLIGIEIPRDELALRIAAPCIGAHPPAGTDASAALDQMDRVHAGMGSGFRRAADAAVLYFHECIQAGVQPS